MKKRLLAFLRVPERPDPPPGAGADLETFRPTRGFFYYQVLMWVPKQAAALAGLLFSLSLFGGMHRWGLDKWQSDGAAQAREILERMSEANVGLAWLRFDLSEIFLFFEMLALVAWAGQLLFTGLLLRASWELRWYMVGERALRIRHGLWTVREQTMTIANIQNMVVRQGPLQRLLGFSDLEITTAGGGGGSSSSEDPTSKQDSFHVGRFQGLQDASALRDKLRRRLQAAQAGVAEPAERPSGHGASHSTFAAPDSSAVPPSPPEPPRTSAAPASLDLLAAARVLAAEARALRQSITAP